MTSVEVASQDVLKIGQIELTSRLIIGTGKYVNFPQMVQALEASGSCMVTVAIRRVNLDKKSESLLDFVDPKKYILLPNTAGCYNVEEAVRTAKLARAACETSLIKLEVIGDPKTLMPDNLGLLKATEILVKDGFTVMPYSTDDPVLAKKLQEAGASCVMPLASPIGSGQGILNRLNITLVKEAVSIPVIVDAGVGTASDAAIAMELGVDGVLMNTGIAQARHPVQMANAMRLAVQAGRLAFLAGRMPKYKYAQSSSPTKELIE
jgi:thiazole synthase